LAKILQLALPVTPLKAEAGTVQVNGRDPRPEIDPLHLTGLTEVPGNSIQT
jgi:hypothetical protein